MIVSEETNEFPSTLIPAITIFFGASVFGGRNCANNVVRFAKQKRHLKLRENHTSFSVCFNFSHYLFHNLDKGEIDFHLFCFEVFQIFFHDE